MLRTINERGREEEKSSSMLPPAAEQKPRYHLHMRPQSFCLEGKSDLKREGRENEWMNERKSERVETVYS